MSSTRFDWPGSWTAELPDEGQVVALLAASDFPEPEAITEVIQAGMKRYGGYVTWVCRERDKLAKEALEAAGLTPVLANLNPHWKWEFDFIDFEQQPGRKLLCFEHESGDRRSEMRDSEIQNRASRIILFTTPNTSTLDGFKNELWESKVRVVERGKKKKKTYAKKGKPVE